MNNTAIPKSLGKISAKSLDNIGFLQKFQNKQHGIIALKRGLSFEQADELGLH